LPVIRQGAYGLAALGLRGKPQLHVEELLEKREVVQQVKGSLLKVTVRVEGGEMLVLGLKAVDS
jgi:hypothetical protein